MVNEKGKSRSTEDSVLRAEGLVKIYRGRKVVDGVSVRVQEGEVVGLLGPNGAGKTTTFYMITGMIRPDSGTVYYDNWNITRRPMYQRARMGIGYLCQELAAKSIVASGAITRDR